MSDSSGEDDSEFVGKRVRNATDLQRAKLEKLMQNPDREVIIPIVKEDKKPRAFEPHEYIRNVMGASAGAGSGEFDIYRGCRRRQMLREEFTNQQYEKKKANEEFEALRQKHASEAEERTAKKRAKRMKRKNKGKQKKDNETNTNTQSGSESGEDREEAEEVDLYELVAGKVEAENEYQKINTKQENKEISVNETSETMKKVEQE